MRALLLCLAFGIALPGCAVRELRDDQDKIRCALLDLYTNQIIDNLIRASNGMPIIQLDYSNAQASITVKETGSLSDSVATTRSTVLNRAAAITSAITRTTLNTVMASSSADHSNQVSVVASPVITSNEVYDGYIAFLTLPGSLQVSAGPPPEGVAHICKKCGGQYYWVPAEFKREFLRLALLTTAGVWTS